MWRMTNEEAINILNSSDYLWMRPTEDENTALCMAIEALEKTQPTGHWTYTDRTNVYGGREIVCSECGESFMISPKTQEQLYECERFCCRCGAKMEKEVEHE